MNDPSRPRDEMRRDVLHRLAEAASGKVAEEEISPTTSLREELDLSSLDSILLVMDLEERLGIDIEDEELASLDTVGDLLELIEAKCDSDGSGSS